tara:strand:+ start:6022 stop:10410 length:4389 start_codon:yes stop_codon:yes gene_type:complete
MIPIPEKFKQGFSHKISGVFPVVVISVYDNGVGKVIRLSQKKGLFGGSEGVFEDRDLKVSSIRERVDVQNRKFQVNQVDISVSNYMIKGERFTEKFEGNTFTNSSVDIYYANDNCRNLEDCLLIYKGFVKNYKADEKRATFTVEDHSQYTLEDKTIPRHSTVDSSQESIDTSKYVYFPMVYGRNEKSPMIFSRPYNESLLSYIYADATHVPGIDILGFDGFINNTPEEEVDPLIILRDSDYLKVPMKFLDLPTDFELIGGENYADKFNGTEQYTVSDNGNAIVLEKKISDFAFSSGLPKNIVAKDQFQVVAERSPSSLTPDQSDDPIAYGEDKQIQYLGQQDGLSSVLSGDTFTFPDPSLGDIQPMGYYQNMRLHGFWDGLAEMGDPNGPFPIWATNMRYVNYLKHPDISDATDGLTGFDFSYRPSVGGHPIWKEIFDLDKMTAWLREQPGGDLLPDDWTMDIGQTRWMGNAAITINIGIGGDNIDLGGDLEANDGIPGGGDALEFIASQMQDWEQFPICEYLYIKCSAENAPILVEGSGNGANFNSLEDDDQEYISITKNIFDTDWDMFLKDGVADWITVHDAAKIGVDPQITNTDVTLNKIIWGRKLTEEEHQYTGIRRGSSIYGIFPTLGNVQITSLENTWFEDYYAITNIYPGTGSFTLGSYYTLNCDALQSYGSADVFNPPADLGDLVRHDLDGDLNYVGEDSPAGSDINDMWPADAKYTEINSPDWIVRQHYTYPDTVAPTSDYYIDPAYSIPAIEEQGYWWVGMVYSAEPNEYGLAYHSGYNKALNSMGQSQYVTHVSYYDFGGRVGYNWGHPNIDNKGVEAMLGGQWALVSNSFGNRIASKLDLTFNSISGSDVVMGSVYSTLRGKIETLFHRNAASTEDTDANMHFMIEATSFDSTPGSNKNDVLKISEILNNTEPLTGDENEAGQQVYDIFHTGHSEDFDNNIYYGTSSAVGTDINSPKYILQECNAMDQSADTYQGGDWSEDVNSVNNVSLYYYLGNDNDDVDSIAVSGYFQTRVIDFKLIQNFVIGNIAKQKYYADVWGRIDNLGTDGVSGRYTGEQLLGNPDHSWLIKRPSDVLMHIVEKELGYDNQLNDFPYDSLSLETARTQHSQWEFRFTVNDKMDSKTFLSEFCQSCKIIPRFRYDGTFSFINLKDDAYTIDETINPEDVIDFSYERTPISDVKLMVRVNYSYDDGLETFEHSTNVAQTGAAPANADYLMERYGIRKLSDAYLEVDSKFIRDEGTAIKLRNHLLLWNMNQHNIIKCSVSPKYMNLEAGDVVNFERLINGMTIFGQDYTKEFFIGLPDQSEIGQVVYPYFMVQEIKKHQNKVDLVLLQIHKFDENVIINDALATFGQDFGVNVHWPEEGAEEGVEGDEFSQIVLGDVNFDQSIDVLDIVQIVDHIMGDNPEDQLGGYNYMAADIDQDNYVTVLDILQIVNHIIDEGEYGDLGVIYE